MTLDAVLVFQPRLGWHLAPSPALEAFVRAEQAPPLLMEMPVTTTASDTDRCSWAACREKATTNTAEGWPFCDEHSAKDAELKTEQDRIITRPAGQPLARPTPLTVVPDAPASPIGRLLEDASAHSQAKVRSLAGRIETQLEQLRALMAEHQVAEAARRAETAAKEKARAEVARLEAELAAAKAALRGGGAASAGRAEPVQRTHRTADCPLCGRTFGHAGAMANHKKHCTGHAS